jgi:hypothetical protein
MNKARAWLAAALYVAITVWTAVVAVGCTKHKTEVFELNGVVVSPAVVTRNGLRCHVVVEFANGYRTTLSEPINACIAQVETGRSVVVTHEVHLIDGAPRQHAWRIQ